MVSRTPGATTHQEHAPEQPAGEESITQPDPEVSEKPVRRKFSARYKLSVLQETDACTQPGEVGAILRREGRYASHLSAWRKERAKGVTVHGFEKVLVLFGATGYDGNMRKLESMEEAFAGIPEGDWAATPERVKRLLVAMSRELAIREAEVKRLREENRYLREQLGLDSRNSSALLCVFIFNVHSTPRNPEAHARRIYRTVDNCHHC